MERRVTVLAVVLVFFVFGVFLASCAKKQVQVTEGAQPTPAQPETAVKKEEVPKETPKVETGLTEEYKKREAERQARLRELERAQRLQEEIQAFEQEMIFFDFDKADLKPEAQAVLRKKADWLLKHPEFNVLIEGHCDERGTNEYNLALGERRANSAKMFLIDLGVPEERISTISYGEERPLDPRHCEEAWAKNRRCEFKLFKK